MIDNLQISNDNHFCGIYRSINPINCTSLIWNTEKEILEYRKGDFGIQKSRFWNTEKGIICQNPLKMVHTAGITILVK